MTVLFIIVGIVVGFVIVDVIITEVRYYIFTRSVRIQLENEARWRALGYR